MTAWPTGNSRAGLWLDRNSWSYCFSSTRFRMLGFSMSSFVLRFRPMRSTAGASPVSVCSVVLYASKKFASFQERVFFSVSAVQRACLNVCTKRSALPFVAGWYGADHMCLMPLFLRNVLNSSDVNWEPLSLTSCSGNLCVANSFLSSSIVLAALVVVIGITSSHFEWLSTTTRNIVPKYSPAKSTWIRCHGRAGHSHAWSGAVLGLFWVSWQPVHPFAACSISLCIPGHQM